MTGTIEHITVSTGASRHSARSEVGGNVVDHIRERIATADGKLEGGWEVKLLPIPSGGHAWQLDHGGQPISICWLCTDPAHSDAFWASVMSVPKPSGTRVHPPIATPWLATILTGAAFTADRNVIMECGDLERCVAWALLE